MQDQAGSSSGSVLTPPAVGRPGGVHGVFASPPPPQLAPVGAGGGGRRGGPRRGRHTRQVTFPLSAQRTATQIRVSGSIPVTFAAWGIPDPSFASVVRTEDHGLLEFLLVFRRA
jgi:hypothetical protein